MFENYLKKSHFATLWAQKGQLSMFCLLEGPSFGKSQLLNGAKLVNQNNNKWREISKSLLKNDSAKAKIFEFWRQKTNNIIFGDFHTLPTGRPAIGGANLDGPPPGAAWAARV